MKIINNFLKRDMPTRQSESNIKIALASSILFVSVLSLTLSVDIQADKTSDVVEIDDVFKPRVNVGVTEQIIATKVNEFFEHDMGIKNQKWEFENGISTDNGEDWKGKIKTSDGMGFVAECMIIQDYKISSEIIATCFFM